MERYKLYKKAYPNKTDAEIIESLALELSDKVETISKLIAENKSFVSGSLGFEEGYSKGYSDAQREATKEIREHYHPNNR